MNIFKIKIYSDLISSVLFLKNKFLLQKQDFKRIKNRINNCKWLAKYFKIFWIPINKILTPEKRLQKNKNRINKCK